MNEIPIFPKWDFKSGRLDDEGDRMVFKCVFKTRLRKVDERTGVWYYWDFVRSFKSYKEFDLTYTQELTMLFINEVYATILIGQVTPGLTIFNGIPVFQKCDSQETEKERIENTLNL